MSTATASTIFSTIVATCKSVSLYGTSHPFVESQCANLVENLKKSLTPKPATLSFNIYEGELYFEATPLPESSTRFATFIAGLVSLGIGSITLEKDLSAAEAARVLATLVQALQSLSQAEQTSAATSPKITGSPHLSFDTLARCPEGMRTNNDETPSIAPRPGIYDTAVRAADNALSEVSHGATPDLKKMSEVVSSMVESILDNDYSLLGLTALKEHDEYTAYHCVNVSVIAVALGARLGMSKDTLLKIGRGAMLHDIGKVRIDKTIIGKESSFDAHEWARMRAHPEEGVKFLCDLDGIDAATLTIVYEHHLCHDLSGYPADFALDSQNLLAAVVQIADVYDGVTSKRPYHPARSPHQALKLIIQKSGKLFHPLIAKEFAAMMGVYPLGSSVLLTDGRLAVVTSATPGDTLHPTLRLENVNGPAHLNETLLPGSVEIAELR